MKGEKERRKRKKKGKGANEGKKGEEKGPTE